MKKVVAALLAVVGISNAHAEWAEVSCVKPDSSDQYPLLNSQGTRTTVSGQWHQDTTVNTNSNFNYFSISEDSYNSIKDQCSEDYIIKPANTDSNLISVFQIYSSTGALYFAPGEDIISIVCPATAPGCFFIRTQNNS